MLVDPIDNPFDAAFAPWPLRFYILHRGRIAYKAQVRWRLVLVWCAGGCCMIGATMARSGHCRPLCGRHVRVQ